MRVVAATQNEHKLKELREILAPFGWEVVSQQEAGWDNVDVVEDGETFEENSRKKAKEIMERSGEIAVADDSGLMVDALQGAPGVYSARYAGEHKSDEDNNQKLLQELASVPEAERGAKFVSVVTMVFPDGREVAARGECPGHILYAPRGNGGFGYDPLFVPDGLNETFAEISQETKNQISHRAKALEQLKRELSQMSF